MRERHEAGLAELADMGLSLARDLHARALAADDAAAADLSLAFQRVSRSVRQTYALESRLERERRLADREIAVEAARERIGRMQKKRTEVRKAVTSLVWTEAEIGDEDEAAEAWLDAIDSRVFEIAEEDDFLDQPLQACIDRIRADLGLPAANDAEPTPPVTVTIWRSSS